MDQQGPIIDQFKEREHTKLKANDELERARQIMLKQVNQLQVDEQTNACEKNSTQNKFQEANFETVDRVDQKRIFQDKEEEIKIFKYNLEKAEKEAEYLEQQRRIKEVKEREIQRLREIQENAAERQAELDDLRVKRAIEFQRLIQKQKQEREKEMKLDHEKEHLINKFS